MSFIDLDFMKLFRDMRYAFKVGCAFLLVQLCMSETILILLACNFILYQCDVLSILGGLSATAKGTSVASNKLIGVGSLLKKLLVSCQSFNLTSFFLLFAKYVVVTLM